LVFAFLGEGVHPLVTDTYC